MARYKHTPENLAAAAVNARSIADVMRLLGVKISGGSHAHISRQLKKFGIDTSHFTGQAHNRGQRAPTAELDVIYDPDATTPTGFPLGRRLPRPPEAPWRVGAFRAPNPAGHALRRVEGNAGQPEQDSTL